MRAQTAPKAGDAVYCGHCACGDHALCHGLALAGPCACAVEASHEPGDEMAAAMRLYQRPDLVGDTTANLAAEYRNGRQS
jgi:hypothetical protein